MVSITHHVQEGKAKVSPIPLRYYFQDRVRAVCCFFFVKLHCSIYTLRDIHFLINKMLANQVDLIFVLIVHACDCVPSRHPSHVMQMRVFKNYGAALNR